MSAQRQMSTPTEHRWGISRQELRRREHMPAKVVRENEYRCPECNLRVTVTKSGTEVGHAYGRKKPECPNHPDSEVDSEKQSTITDW